MKSKPIVGIIMGSDSDLPTMQEAAKVCEDFGVPYELKITSAHRTPNFMAKYAESAHTRGIKVIIAGAGGAAHLPGMAASYSPLPVIGVPIRTKALEGIDSLLSIVQMPGGVPVATVLSGMPKTPACLQSKFLPFTKKIFSGRFRVIKRSCGMNHLRKIKSLKSELFINFMIT